MAMLSKHCMQGRFWQEQFDSLNVPAASKEKFQFVDGNPRVILSFLS